MSEAPRVMPRFCQAVHVPKIGVPARLSQPNLAPRDGCFQLFPKTGPTQRPESLLELLNSRRCVIPFILAGDASMLLLTRSNIDWVAVGPQVEAELVLPPGLEHNCAQQVELRFVDESRVDATIEWFTETGQERLSDFLNACDTFVASRAGFGTLIWNKERIRETLVREADQRRNPSAA
jgi:hypothetical protein